MRPKLMTIPVERKFIVYLGMILIIQLILFSLIEYELEKLISRVIAVSGLLTVSLLLMLCAIIFRRKIKEHYAVETKLRDSEQELRLALRSSKESQAGLFAKEIEA